jgi:predicted N-acyltransferase
LSGADPAQSGARRAAAGPDNEVGELQLSFASSMREIGASDWAGLCPGEQPFVSYGFLEALEASDCVSEETGWIPQHVTLRDAGGELVAAMPAYLKLHSWGEFVFDWAWADAYRRYGLDYYPKLVCAIPFTPVTGQRILMPPRPDRAEVSSAMLSRLAQAVGELDVSSLHLLFPDETARQAMVAEDGWMLRKDCQFQWHNRDYAEFTDYLATFTSAKRKKLKRERRRIEEQGIRFEWLGGQQIDEATWHDVYRFYASTFHKRGHSPYFSQPLFQLLAERLGPQLQVCLARHGSTAVAAAVFFRDDHTLYGRYWGCDGEYHSLHFETCYYQGIEFCIREGLQRFEPGTQGEHKLSRGFEPTATWSGHVIGEPAFASAIEHYLLREQAGVDAYMDAAGARLPFREQAPPTRAVPHDDDRSHD